jgi:hypothetical protein
MKEQITFARKQIRADLEAAMKTSPRYQMSARNNKSGNSSSSTPAADTSQLNQSLINEHLAAFDQFFTEHQFCFTKEKLREFCTTHNFEVPIPALSLSPRRRLSTATEDSIGEQLQSATKRVKSFLNEKSSQLLASTPALVNKLDEANNYFNNQIFTQERINTALESGKKTIEVMDAPLKKIQEQLLTPERQEHLTLAAANAAAIGNQITDSVMKQLSDMSEQAISNGRQAVKNTTQFISPLKNSKSMEGIELMSTPQKAPSSSSSSSSSLSSSSEITSLLSNNDNDHDYQSLSHSSSSALDKNVQINNNIDATDQYFQWWL